MALRDLDNTGCRSTAVRLLQAPPSPFMTTPMLELILRGQEHE